MTNQQHTTEAGTTLRGKFPNADTAHGHGTDSFVLEWEDAYLVVTPEEADIYMLGVYTVEAWTEGIGEYVTTDLVAADVIDVVDYLTDMQPEGTGFYAWSSLRLVDEHDADRTEV